jgi:hypothetical protein
MGKNDLSPQVNLRKQAHSWTCDFLPSRTNVFLKDDN